LKELAIQKRRLRRSAINVLAGKRETEIPAKPGEQVSFLVRVKVIVQCAKNTCHKKRREF